MTLIFGARCVDGVIIVGDKLVTSGESVSYIDKIRKCGNIEWAIFGAAGLGSLYEEFLTRLPDNVNHTMAWMNFQNAKNEKDRKEAFGDNPNAPELSRLVYTVENFKHDCVALLNDMMNRYAYAFDHDNDCILQILIGVHAGSEANLYYLDSIDCLPFQVKESYFIGQSHLVEVFKKCWNPSMTMLQSIKLGCFAIRYVETAELSKSVGIGNSGVAQIWVIPDGQAPKEITGDTVTAFTQKIDQEVKEIFLKLNTIFRAGI